MKTALITRNYNTCRVLCLLIGLTPVISQIITCEDSALYLDRFGLRCENYSTIDCKGMGVVGFRTYEIQAVMNSCPLSCKLCKPKLPTIAPSDHPTPKPTPIFTSSPSLIPSKSSSNGPSTTSTISPSKAPSSLAHKMLRLRPSSLPSYIQNATQTNKPTGEVKRNVRITPFEVSMYPSSILMVDELKIFLSTTDSLLRNLILGLYPQVIDISFSTIILDQSVSTKKNRKLTSDKNSIFMLGEQRILQGNTTLTIRLEKTALIYSQTADAASDGITTENLNAAVKFIFDESSQMTAPLVKVLPSKFASTFGSLQKIDFVRFITDTELEGYKNVQSDQPGLLGKNGGITWKVYGSMTLLGLVVVLFGVTGLVQYVSNGQNIGSSDESQSSLWRRKPWMKPTKAGSPTSVSSVGMHSAGAARYRNKHPKKKTISKPKQNKKRTKTEFNTKKPKKPQAKESLKSEGTEKHGSGQMGLVIGKSAFVPVAPLKKYESIDSIGKEMNRAKMTASPKPPPFQIDTNTNEEDLRKQAADISGLKNKVSNNGYNKTFEKTVSSSFFFAPSDSVQENPNKKDASKARGKSGKEVALERARRHRKKGVVSSEDINESQVQHGVPDADKDENDEKDEKDQQTDTQHRFPYYQGMDDDSFLENPDKFFLESASYSTNGERDYSFQMTTATLATMETGVGSIDKQHALQQINDEHFNSLNPKGLPAVPEEKTLKLFKRKSSWFGKTKP